MTVGLRLQMDLMSSIYKAFDRLNGSAFDFDSDELEELEEDAIPHPPGILRNSQGKGVCGPSKKSVTWNEDLCSYKLIPPRISNRDKEREEFKHFMHKSVSDGENPDYT